jgi:hypothetical protein
MANGKRTKLTLVLVVLAASGIALFAWTRVWINATVTTGGTESARQQLEIAGSTAAPALTALALAGLALAGALTIAGPVIRLVLGVLQVVLGGCVMLAAYLAVSDPAGASSAAVTAATGIAGEQSILDGIESTTLTAWPFVALGAGAVMALAGIAILATSRSWPQSASRYQAVRMEPVGMEPGVTNSGATTDGQAPIHASRSRAATDATGRSVDSWDDLSRGSDPTS